MLKNLEALPAQSIRDTGEFETYIQKTDRQELLKAIEEITNSAVNAMLASAMFNLEPITFNLLADPGEYLSQTTKWLEDNGQTESEKLWLKRVISGKYRSAIFHSSPIQIQDEITRYNSARKRIPVTYFEVDYDSKKLKIIERNNTINQSSYIIYEHDMNRVWKVEKTEHDGKYEKFLITLDTILKAAP